MKPMIDENGYLALDEFVYAMPSFKSIMEDKRVTEEEMENQVQVVMALIRKVDQTLGESDRDLVWNMVGELSVLFELHAIQEAIKP
jgi:hypothetical protein